MVTRRVSTGIFDFSGGVNATSVPLNLSDNELFECINMRLGQRRELEKRRGYIITDNFGSDPIRGLFQVVHAHSPGEHNKHDIVVTGTTIWGREDEGPWVDITGSYVVDPLLSFHISQYNDFAIATDGVNRGFKWDGSGNVVLLDNLIDVGPETLDSFVVSVVHDNQLVVGNITTSNGGRLPSRIWVADAGTEDGWVGLNDAGVLDVDKGNGGEITNLQSTLGYLIIFKENGLYRVVNYGTSSMEVKKITNVGCAGKRASVVVGGLIYFLDQTGQLWAYDPTGDNEDSVVNVTSSKLGKRITDTFANLSESALSHWQNRGEVVVSVSDREQNSIHWHYNIYDGGFWLAEYLDSVAFMVEFIGAGETYQIIGASYTGDIYRMDFGQTDRGAFIPWTFTTRHIAFNPALLKGWRKMDLYVATMQDTTITVEQRNNFERNGEIRMVSVDV